MSAEIGPDEFRRVLGHLPTGVTVLTAFADGEPVGMAANSVTAVSLDPPLVLACPARTSETWPLVREAGRFCVNVLTQEHKDLAATFAGGLSDMDARYAAAAWTDLPSGNQALADAIVSFDCRLADVRPVGTHNIFIGEVVDVRSRKDGHALLYFDRSYVHVPTHTGSFGG